jgi:hypothetical protein
VAKLSWKQALAWRMRRHGLVERASPGELLEVAGRICGLHAQVMSSAELTLWARLEGLAPDAVRRALWEERSLVKLWAMRGTLHLLPAEELGTWLGGLGTYEHYLKPVWLRNFEITREELDELIDAVGRALDGELRTREELAAEIELVTGSPAMGERVRGSWGPYLKPASFRGRLCFGPGEGQRVRFTQPWSWLPGGVEEVEAEEALREITRRYLGAFAPATREDLGRWWAVSPARAGRMLRSLGAEAVELDVEGDSCWMLAEHAAEAAATKPENRQAAGVDLPLRTRKRADRGRLAPRAKGRPARRRDRAVRQAARLGPQAGRARGPEAARVPRRPARGPLERPRRRLSAWPTSSSSVSTTPAARR